MGANILEFNSVVLSIVSDIPRRQRDAYGDFINLENLPSQSSKILIEGRVCVHVFIGCECACVVSVGVVLCDLKKDRDVFWRSPDFICY